jgi:hypothetical protein
MPGAARRVAALLAAACVLLTAAPAGATALTLRPAAPNVYKLGGDVLVSPDQVVGTVLIFGGNLTVAGRIEGSAVVIGGHVHLLSSGVVSRTVFCLGGVQRDLGSVVVGNVVSLRGNQFLARVASGLYRTVRSPFQAGTLLGWGATTLLYIIVAVVAAGLFSRQTGSVRERIVRHAGSSLGWGAMGAVVVVPAISVLLLVSVIGVLVLIPWLLIVVPIAFFFGFACVSALAGRSVLSLLGVRSERLVASAVVGVLLLHVLRLIPYAGSVLWALAWLVGFGAVAAEVYLWGRGGGGAPRAPPPPPQAPPRSSGTFPAPPEVPRRSAPARARTAGASPAPECRRSRREQHAAPGSRCPLTTGSAIPCPG